jgi:hypothetical protein
VICEKGDPLYTAFAFVGFRQKMPAQLPSDYLRYVEEGADWASTNGEPGYFQLWPLDEVEEMNQSYRVTEYAPGFLGFGSDGGGEMLAFDRGGAVFMIPFVGMAPEEAKKIGTSWSEIVARIEE